MHTVLRIISDLSISALEKRNNKTVAFSLSYRTGNYHRLRMTASVLIALLLSGGIIHIATSFSFGAPSSACSSLYPAHHHDAQLSDPPFSINVHKTNYKPGDQIIVNLVANSGFSFMGFVTTVNRVSGDMEELLGTFEDVGEGSKSQYWYPQQPGFKNCATHMSNVPLENMTLVWRAPDWESAGDIRIRSSFVMNFATFWVRIHSPIITALVEPPSHNEYPEVSLDFSPMKLTECGVSKGCTLFPNFCSSTDDCTYALTYSARSQGVMFEMMGRADGYLAVGLSHDELMGDDETVSCVMTNDYIGVQHGYNPKQYNHRTRLTGLTNIETKREGDYIYCRWTHPYVMTIDEIDSSVFPPKDVQYTFDLKNDWYIQLAWGRLYPGTDYIHKHDELPLVSVTKVNLTETMITRSTSLPLHTKVHALLGIVSWMLLAGPTIMVSRHYKTGALSKQIINKPLWFQAHRFLAFAIVVITIVSVILMFAVMKMFTLVASTHAIIGLVVSGLVILQVIAGLCRPGLDHKNRPVFNWIHRLSGAVTFVLAGVTIILSTTISIIYKDLAAVLFIIFLIWFFTNVAFFIVIEIAHTYRKSKTYALNDPGSNPNMEVSEKMKDSDGGSMCHVMLFAIYLLWNMGLSIASIVYIFIH